MLTSENWLLKPEINDSGNVSIGIALRGLEEPAQEDALQMIEDPQERQAVDTLLTNLNKNFKRSLNGLFLLVVPIQSILTWLFFRKRKFNLAEHLVANAFICGLLNVLYILVGPIIVNYPTSVLPLLVVLVVVITYLIAAVFKSKGWVRALIASSFVNLLTALIYSISVVAILLSQSSF